MLTCSWQCVSVWCDTVDMSRKSSRALLVCLALTSSFVLLLPIVMPTDPATHSDATLRPQSAEKQTRDVPPLPTRQAQGSLCGLPDLLSSAHPVQSTGAEVRRCTGRHPVSLEDFPECAASLFEASLPSLPHTDFGSCGDGPAVSHDRRQLCNAVPEADGVSVTTVTSGSVSVT